MAKKVASGNGAPKPARTFESVFGGNTTDTARDFYARGGAVARKETRAWTLCFAIRAGIAKSILANDALHRLAGKFADVCHKASGELCKEAQQRITDGKHPLYMHHGMALANGQRESVNAFTAKSARAALAPCTDDYVNAVAYPASLQYCNDAQIKEPPSLEEFKANLLAWLNE